MTLDLDEVRHLYPHTQEQIYFNHASISPVSTHALAQMQIYLQERHHDSVENFQQMIPRMEALRARIARYINAEGPENIAFVGNTSTGLNLLAAGLKWRSGERIVLNNMEFPANIYPFLQLRRQGVELEIVPAAKGYVSLEHLADAITEETRVLSVSAVQFLSGQRMPLAQLGSVCQAHQVLFCVDGIQALGAQRLDVQALGIDFLATGGHKWLMGLEGLGFVYIAPALLENLEMAHVGWLSVDDAWELLDYDLRLRADAARFELGTPNFIGMMALNAALESFEHFGYEAVENQVLDLSDALVDALQARGLGLMTPLAREERLGIVTFEHERAELLHAELQRQRVFTAAREGRYLRFAPHYYNCLEEVERLFGILDPLL